MEIEYIYLAVKEHTLLSSGVSERFYDFHVADWLSTVTHFFVYVI